MKVFNNPQIQQVLKSYQKTVAKTEKSEPAAMAQDKIEISDAAKDAQVAMKAFNDVPEVRQDKIDELKSQIQSGQYKPSTEAVADKLLESIRQKNG